MAREHAAVSLLFRLLEQSGLSSQELLGNCESIYLCCSSCSALAECFDKPVAIRLYFSLVGKLRAAVRSILSHASVLLHLVFPPLGDNIFKCHHLPLQVRRKLLCCGPLLFVFHLRLFVSALLFAKFIVQVLDNVAKQTYDVL